MASDLLPRLRKLWRTVHLWLGVGLLVAIIPLSATGAVLVWRDALERGLSPDRFAVSPGPAAWPASAYLAAGARAFEGRARPGAVRFPGPEGGPVVVTGRGRRTPGAEGPPPSLSAWIDPVTLRVTAVADPRTGPQGLMHRLHGQLMIPEIGRRVVGWIGWAMFVSSATGLWLWWPLRGGMLRGFRWSRGTGTLFNLHHLVGFWVCLPLAMLSLTGVYISFPQTSHALFGIAAPTQGGGGRGGVPLEATHLTIDQAISAAIAGSPGTTVVSATLPARGRDPSWRIAIRPPGAAEPVTLQISDASGQLRSSTGPGAADPLSRWIRRLHDGAAMPMWFRLLITAGGAAPVILALTGTVMWLQRRGRTPNKSRS